MKVSLDHGKTWHETDRASIKDDDGAMIFVYEADDMIGIVHGDAESDEDFDSVYGQKNV